MLIIGYRYRKQYNAAQYDTESGSAAYSDNTVQLLVKLNVECFLLEQCQNFSGWE